VAAPWQRSVESIIETGVRLTEMKEKSGHGNWMEVVSKELGWSIRMADMLMAIGRSFSNWTKLSSLPPSWGTLYELTKFPETELLERIEAGEITSATRRQEVGKLKKAGKPMKNKSDPWTKFQKAADKFFTEVQSLACTGGFGDLQYGSAKATRDEIVTRLDELMINLDNLTRRKEKNGSSRDNSHRKSIGQDGSQSHRHGQVESIAKETKRGKGDQSGRKKLAEEVRKATGH
jgi:hypothetical protein